MSFVYAFLPCRHLYWCLCLRSWVHEARAAISAFVCMWRMGGYTCIYHHHHQKPPPHSASCLSVRLGSVLVGGRKNTNDASCNWWNHRGCKWSLCANSWERNTRTSISASWNGMQHATPTTTTTDQLRISTGAGGVHDAAIIATCVRANNSNSFHALPLLCIYSASCKIPY